MTYNNDVTNPITYDDFNKIDIRAGRVIRAESFPQAHKPAIKLWLDLGTLGIKQSSAQITRRYKHQDLVGRQLLAVVNLPPRQIADFISEVLVLGVVNGKNDVILVTPDQTADPGARML